MSEPKSEALEQRLISLLWAGPEVAGEIAHIQSEVDRPGWGEEALRDMLANPCSNSLISKVRLNELNPPVTVGYVMSQIAADEIEILSIGVLKPFQRFGLGTQLVEGLARAATRAEAKKIFLEVALDNEPAISLYKKLGFAEIGRRDRYYKRTDGTAVDALTMARAV